MALGTIVQTQLRKTKILLQCNVATGFVFFVSETHRTKMLLAQIVGKPIVLSMALSRKENAMTITETQKYLEDTLGGKWSYKKVYGLIYHGGDARFTSVTPPDDFIPFRKIGATWHTRKELVDDWLNQQFQMPNKKQELESQTKVKRKVQHSSQWGKI